MATWHQQKAWRTNGFRWRPTRWTIVSDTPNQTLSHTVYDDEVSARAALARRLERGEKHCWLDRKG